MKKTHYMLTLVIVLALVLVACGGSGSDEPIKIGMAGAVTGPFVEPEAIEMAEAYFARVNENGGIQGRQVELFTYDDQTDGAAAAQNARRLVDEEGIVAMVGNASALDCAVNGALYVETGMVSIPGTGVDAVCYLNPNISAVNAGPFTATALGLYYLSENLGHENICGFFTQLPGTEEGYRGAVARWEGLTGRTITLQDYSYAPGSDPTPLVISARDSGCDAAIYLGAEFMSLAWVNAINAQGVREDIQWLFGPPAYTAEFPAELGADGEGVMVMSEMAPWTLEPPELDDYKTLAENAGVQRTAFGVGTYIAADIFVDVLEGIDGEITRESVTAAFKSLDPIDTPLLNTPYTFGSAEMHASNNSIVILKMEGGQWVEESAGWVTFP